VKKTKKILVCAAVAACLLALFYALLFTTTEIPAFLVNPTAGAVPQEKHTALVLKRFRRETLKPGDLVLFQIRTDTASNMEVGKLEKIQFPKDSQRLKASGRHRAIGQAILDMDFKPNYWISTGESTNSITSLRIPEADIKGKVVHSFTNKRK
jgi:hypothetical protein